MRGSRPSRPSCSGRSATATSTAGRSRAAISTSSAAARPSRCIDVVRHNREDVRSLARLLEPDRRRLRRSRDDRRRAADRRPRRARPVVRPGAAGSTRRSTASTRRWRPRPPGIHDRPPGGRAAVDAIDDRPSKTIRPGRGGTRTGSPTSVGRAAPPSWSGSCRPARLSVDDGAGHDRAGTAPAASRPARRGGRRRGTT